MVAGDRMPQGAGIPPFCPRCGASQIGIRVVATGRHLPLDIALRSGVVVGDLEQRPELAAVPRGRLYLPDRTVVSVLFFPPGLVLQPQDRVVRGRTNHHVTCPGVRARSTTP